MENFRKDELVKQILGWISKRNISIIPVTMNLCHFIPALYSADESKMLIQKGFNPKMYLYRLDHQTRTGLISDWTYLLGKNFTKVNNNFWFCMKKSDCDKNCSKGCKDKTANFIHTKGHRTLKNVKLGEGGFGKVFLGNIHGVKVGAKYIDVTKEYRRRFLERFKLLYKIRPPKIFCKAIVISFETYF